MFLTDEATRFLEKLFVDMAAGGLTLEPHWDVDHLCYRVESLPRYKEMKAKLESCCELLVESEVNGRMISTFKLQEPIRFQHHEISVIELPAPKVGKVVVEGFEHIEVVCDVSFEFLMNEHPDLKPDRSGLKKLFNKELEFNFASGAVKFHHLSLESVVELEKNTKVWNAIQESHVLDVLKTYEPLIAGTFPLGLSVSGSDVDIVVGAGDLEYIQSVIQDAFHKYPQFSVEQKPVDGKMSLIARFEHQSITFEIFAQNLPGLRQKAYQHFLAEEKILKLGGSELKKKIQELRLQGLKTEPAFAQALKLTGDAYEEILRLQKMPLDKIRNSIGL